MPATYDPEGLGTVRRTSPWRAAWAILAVVVLGGWYAWSYGDALHMFFHLDDYWALAGGARVKAFEVVPLFYPTHGFLFYRPLSTIGYFHVLYVLFGTDPVRFHAVHLACQAANALLVYFIADRLFFSRPLALATALVYAAAPGHALAAYWLAVYTLTGAAFFYYLGLLAWLSLDGRLRLPVTFVLFATALLESEHAVTFPLGLTVATFVLDEHPDWRRALRQLAPFYAVLALYLAGKTYAIGYLTRTAPPNDASGAWIWTNYHMVFAPGSVLTMVGRYVAFGLGPLYAPDRLAPLALVLGAVTVAVGVLVVAIVLHGDWRGRTARVTAFGFAFFLVALGPIEVLPAHVYSCYIGLAMLGLALGLVGLAASIPRFGGAAVAVLLAVVVVVHVRNLPLVRQSSELRYVDSFSDRAARWLYALSAVPIDGSVQEVVVPDDQVTSMTFGLGDAARWFLCAPYRVRTVKSPAEMVPAPGRVVVAGPARALPEPCAAFSCVRRQCAG